MPGPNAEWGRPLVVTNEFLHDEAQVPVVDWNQIIQTLTADRSDEQFAKRVRCRSANRRSNRSYAKILQRCVE